MHVVRQKVTTGSTVIIYKYPLRHQNFDSNDKTEVVVLDIWSDLNGINWWFTCRCISCNHIHKFKFNRIVSVKSDRSYSPDTEFIVVPFWINIDDFTDEHQDYAYARKPYTIYIPKKITKRISKRYFENDNVHDNNNNNENDDDETINNRDYKRPKTNSKATRHNLQNEPYDSYSSSDDEYSLFSTMKNDKGNDNDNSNGNGNSNSNIN